MEENYYEDFEIDLGALFKKLWDGKKTIILCTAVAAVIGLVVAFSLPKQYRVTSILAPELKMNKSSLGGLSSLTSLAGISSSMLTSTEAMYPDLYPVIIESTPFLLSLAEMPVTVKSDEGPKQTDLQDYILNYQKAPWWGKVIGFPMGLVHRFFDLFQKKPETAGQAGESADAAALPKSAPIHLSEEQSIALKGIASHINMEVEKKTALITITVVMQDPVIAANVMSAVLDRLQSYVTGYRTEKARNDLEYMQTLNDEARANYAAAQQKFARYADANQNIVLLRVKAEQDRLMNEVNLAYQLFMQTSQQLQLSKAKVQESTPVFAVVQPSVVPVKPCKPSKTIILLVWLMLGGCTGAALVLFRKEDDKEESN